MVGKGVGFVAFSGVGLDGADTGDLDDHIPFVLC